MNKPTNGRQPRGNDHRHPVINVVVISSSELSSIFISIYLPVAALASLALHANAANKCLFLFLTVNSDNKDQTRPDQFPEPSVQG